jgi:uncharacterized protein (TIGR01777 family)
VADDRPLLVTGATGLVGCRLLAALARDGAPARVLTRNPGRAQAKLPHNATALAWDGVRPPAEALAGTRAVVHLAGEPVFGGPPTVARRRRIRDSRVDSTDHLVEAIAALPTDARPASLVCASAVGFYGDRADETLSEDAGPGEGFLADVCRDWEAAAMGADAHGVRPSMLRIGIVLAREGGALPLMARPFRLGVGGRIGTGEQWVPWIHADDLVSLIRAAVDDARYRGPINAAAPEPVRNAELTRELAQLLRRPALLPVPGVAVRALLGEVAGELLGSRRVVPTRAEALGFEFAYPRLAAALAAELSP